MLSPALSPAGGVRKRTRIAEMLESSRKKRQVLREDLEKDRHRDLRRVGVEVGSKVYVRYEYDDLLEEENTEEPIVLESKVVWWPAKVCLYRGPGSYAPGGTEDGILRPVRKDGASSRKEVSAQEEDSGRKAEDEAGEEEQDVKDGPEAGQEVKEGPEAGQEVEGEQEGGSTVSEVAAGVDGSREPAVLRIHAEEESSSVCTRVCSDTSVCTETVVRTMCSEEGAEGEERLYKAAEVFESMRASFSRGAYVDRMAELVRQNEDKVVYLLNYEGRDEFPPESVPCFFLDKENLVHLHQAWGFAAYRTDLVPSDEEEEGLFLDDLDSGSIVGQIADKVITVISRFYKHAETLNTKSISADDVWAYFDQIPEVTLILSKRPNQTGPVEDHSIVHVTSNFTPTDFPEPAGDTSPLEASSAQLTDGENVRINDQLETTPSLQDAPFPRRPDP
ncbi:hypothetical protein GNI_086980 [Gregarina niphandrodes]|uniref:Uncharacterized protein n=1 Tax=Gregarina niphandrodes TaxID=110365 RepID=A0A023B5U9_GRENI|nr:hypothetical protein GNI_086980 [Gregarina niphandrodes]EZG63293.1 hypothetical protein GNI_086980 [Gregarina niphandrodes]|eukprot:XP_011130685.1 hypothetical protein GNI_086980 [Gregarina niphandrodes]